jgi:hypothetical protein
MAGLGPTKRMSLINEQNFAKRLPLPSRSHIRITPKPFHYLIAKNQPKIAGFEN